MRTSNGNNIYCPKCQGVLTLLVASSSSVLPFTTLYMGNCHSCGSAVQLSIQAKTHWKESIKELFR